MSVYALVDENGNVVNRCRWDGLSAWSPPEGLIAVEDIDGRSWIGGTWSGSSFSAMPTKTLEIKTQTQKENEAINWQIRSIAAQQLGLTTRATEFAQKAQDVLNS